MDGMEKNAGGDFGKGRFGEVIWSNFLNRVKPDLNKISNQKAENEKKTLVFSSFGQQFATMKKIRLRR